MYVEEKETSWEKMPISIIILGGWGALFFFTKEKSLFKPYLSPQKKPLHMDVCSVKAEWIYFTLDLFVV